MSDSRAGDAGQQPPSEPSKAKTFTDFVSCENHGAKTKAAQQKAVELQNQNSVLELENSVLKREKEALQWKNSGIAKTYVNDWGVKEGIREFLQNLIDACTTSNGGTREGMSFDPTEGTPGSYSINGRKGPLGAILHENAGTLRLMNAGTLSKKNLLLGGTDKLDGGDAIIGRFGEGMKLGILSLCRPDPPKVADADVDDGEIVTKVDPQSGQDYYYNTVTQKTAWTRVEVQRTGRERGWSTLAAQAQVRVPW
jgi:hypothetical protein